MTAAAGRPLSLLALVGVALALGACRRTPSSAPSSEPMATAPVDVDPPAPASPTRVVTYHYDNLRTGWNFRRS